MWTQPRRMPSFRKNRDIRFHENCLDTHEKSNHKINMESSKINNTKKDSYWFRFYSTYVEMLDDWRMGNFLNRKLLFHEIASKPILIGKLDTRCTNATVFHFISTAYERRQISPNSNRLEFKRIKNNKLENPAKICNIFTSIFSNLHMCQEIGTFFWLLLLFGIGNAWWQKS